MGSESSSGCGGPQGVLGCDLGSQVGPTPESQQILGYQGWPPKVTLQSGPAFESLENHQKADLRRLHANLGHPSPEKLSRALQDQGASVEVVKAAQYYQCDSCIENQIRPKLPNPATIYSPKEFNDCVGGDCAYWTYKQGRRFHFMHFIDEATLFHLGAPSGRSVEEQIETFENVWLEWAGPCKEMYLDPAGEYLDDRCHEFLQKEGIQLSVAAGESHWQVGRVEAHGRIVKQMLTAMDVEESIVSPEDFRKCLRQVFAAKNSLSAIAGYTPEQAVLGKVRALPASLVSDSSAAAHSLAESNSQEGIDFRESLRKRELARKACLLADNSNALRRALLRRPRKDPDGYSKGDWVLYWRQNKGNLKGERGRWHGPGQIVTIEGSRRV